MRRWLQQLKARAQQPRSPIDLWIQRQREIVLRLPKWLVGTWTISSLGLGVWCAIENHGLMPLLRHLYRDPVYAGLGTVSLTVLPLLVVLYGIARVLRPRPPSNLPEAHVRR